MAQPVGFNVEDYFNDFANESAMAEAARFKTIPTGSYQAQVTKSEGRYFEQKDGKSGGKYWSAVFTDDPTPKAEWRKGVQVTADVLNEEGKKISTTRLEASWEDKRDDKGNLDKMFKQWEQLTLAVFPNLKVKEGERKSTGEVLQALAQYPIKLMITESFKTVAIDGSTKWKTAANAEEAKTFREAGYEPRNFTQRVSKV